MVDAELHARAAQLEDHAAALRRELDEIYAQIADEDEGDSFMARMADKFRGERDRALREVAELKARLASEDNAQEARALRAEEKLREAQAVIGAILNKPLSDRREVQSSLLMLNQRLEKS